MASPADPIATPSASDNCRGVVPLSTWVLISNFKLSYNLLRRPNGTLDRHLAEFLDRKVPADLNPVEGISSIDIIIDRATGLWGRIFWSSTHSNNGTTGSMNGDEDPSCEDHPSLRKPLLVYFHGGSFAHSSANSAIYDAMCRNLCKSCKVVVLSLNFRRAPEHPCPAAYEDGLMCVRWAQIGPGRQCLTRLGCDPRKCYVAGDSSGGNIAHHVAARIGSEIAGGGGGLSLSGMILLMPMFGGEERTPAEKLLDGKFFVTVKDRDWYWRAFLPIGANRDHPACNPFSPSAPSLGEVKLPPCLVVVGGLDLLQDWQLRYVHSLHRQGKSVQLMFLEQATMGFFLLPNTEQYYSLLEKMREFLKQP